MLIEGPAAQSREDRHRRLEAMLDRLRRDYGEGLLAAALYGSLSRGEDGPYSDIELFCLLDEPGDRTLEWIYGAGKAEINLYGWDDARRRAAEVDEFWALSAGQFVHATPLEGDPGLVDELRAVASSPSDASIAAQVRASTVGELYEWIGKLRNAHTAGRRETVALLACRFTELTALILALASRRVYSGSAGLFRESLELRFLPEGYERLCAMVMRGDLRGSGVTQAIGESYRGLIAWEQARGFAPEVSEWPEG